MPASCYRYSDVRKDDGMSATEMESRISASRVLCSVDVSNRMTKGRVFISDKEKLFG